MKLYNLYKDIILEETMAKIGDTPITVGAVEGTTEKEISKLIDIAIEGGTAKNGRPFTNWVNIWYQKEEGGPKRKMFVYILGRGKLKGGTHQDAIRIWDPGYGGTKRERTHKTLLVHKIRRIKVMGNPKEWDSSRFQQYAKFKINPPNDKLFQGGKYQDGKTVKI
jgi:hypothetical protein